MLFPNVQGSVEQIYRKIREVLKKIEQENNITILFAIENGSRCWGMSSTDSDYDIRFVYYRNVDKYLSLTTPKDVLTFAFDDNFSPCDVEGSLLDMCGFDIFKYFKLLSNSNPSAIEWMFSDIVYYGQKDIHLIEHLEQQFDPKKLYFHYFSLFKTHKEIIDKEATTTYKKYLYAMRGLLNAKYVEVFDKLPPLHFKTTLDLLKDNISAEIYSKVLQMIKLKSYGKEKKQIEKLSVIDDFFNSEINKEPPLFEDRKLDKDIFETYIQKKLLRGYQIVLSYISEESSEVEDPIKEALHM